jgi:hypothetical protein
LEEKYQATVGHLQKLEPWAFQIFFPLLYPNTKPAGRQGPQVEKARIHFV